MKEQILEMLQKQHKKTGGNCGTYIAEINTNLNTNFKTIKNTLNELFVENKIIIRDGSKGKLIFYKDDKSN